MIQRKPAREVIVIEVGAIDAVGHDVQVSLAAETRKGELRNLYIAPRQKTFL
jgi:hypothetical protein